MQTKYYKTWPENKEANNISDREEPVAAPVIQGYEEMMFAFVLFLCV